jgi:peptidoglycan/LPS O-acetylase OafA/YrhL
MGDDRFITRPMSIALDLVRSLAALVVLVGHCVQLGIYTGPYPFSELAQHNAVVVFFVLSGLVIANSTLNTKSDLTEYAIARAVRIVPLALFSIAVSIFIFVIYRLFSLDQVSNPVANSHLTLESTLLPMLFLSESGFGSGPVWNPPYWSLCYEVWYYALFGAAIFLRGTRRTLWVLALAAAAGPRILLLFPLWLTGAWLVRDRRFRSVSWQAGIPLCAVSVALFTGATQFAVPGRDLLFSISGMGEPEFRFSQFLLTDLALGVAVATGFVGLRPLAAMFAPSMERFHRPIRAAAGASFGIYLLHWPLLCLLRTLDIGAGSSLILFGPVLAGVIATSVVLAALVERNQNQLRTLLQNACASQSRQRIVV